MSDLVIRGEGLLEVAENHHVRRPPHRVCKRVADSDPLLHLGGVPAEHHRSLGHVLGRIVGNVDPLTGETAPGEQGHRHPDGVANQRDRLLRNRIAGGGLGTGVDMEHRFDVPAPQGFPVTPSRPVANQFAVEREIPGSRRRDEIQAGVGIRGPDGGGALHESGSGQHQAMLPGGQVEPEASIGRGARGPFPGAQERPGHRRPGNGGGHHPAEVGFRCGRTGNWCGRSGIRPPAARPEGEQQRRRQPGARAFRQRWAVRADESLHWSLR